jgi:transposase
VLDTHNGVTHESYSQLRTEPDKLIQLVVERDHALAERDREIVKLQNIIRLANQRTYGPKTEKLSAAQLALSFELPPVQPELPLKAEVVVEKHTRTIRRGRKALPDNLPREEVVYLPEETHCSCCNAELVQIGEHRTQELEKVPAQLKVIEHVRPKMACSKCKGAKVLVAPLPAGVFPIEGARPGPGLLADIAVSKYVDAIPLHRQEQMFARIGIELSRKRMCDWIEGIVELLMPLYLALKREILEHPYIQADETTLKVQDGAKPNVCHTGYLWGIHGPPRSILYHYAEGRAGDVPKELLDGYQGVVQTDAYAGYNKVFVPEGCQRLACLAHIRREFIECQSSAGQECGRILKLFADVYRGEVNARTPEERLAVRQARTRRLLEELFVFLKVCMLKTLPKSPLAKALSYAIKQEVEVMRIMDSGAYELDNNSIERQMKYIAIGRKNYYFAGSHEGARRAAVLYSLLGTCRLNKVNPWEWLSDVLVRVNVRSDDTAISLLPMNWKKKPVS